jgi:hypothetical protein
MTDTVYVTSKYKYICIYTVYSSALSKIVRRKPQTYSHESVIETYPNFTMDNPVRRVCAQKNLQ